ncbi:Uncharacterised protein [Serratia proteamaculans]|nr:Uncharacterised protein [Serratia proteamaculans]
MSQEMNNCCSIIWGPQPEQAKHLVFAGGCLLEATGRGDTYGSNNAPAFQRMCKTFKYSHHSETDDALDSADSRKTYSPHSAINPL